MSPEWTKQFFREEVFFPGGRTQVAMARGEAAFAARALGLGRIDAAFLRAQGMPKNWSEREDGSFLLEDFELFEGRDPHATNTWTILRGGKKPLRRSFFTRCYDYDRLAAALQRAGLEPVKRWG